MGFGHLHIFSYSPRAGTKAAGLPDQVPVEVKKARSREMHALDRRVKRETLEKHVGRRYPVLIEGRYQGEADGDWFGYTPNYLPVRLLHMKITDPVNRILDIRLDGVHPEGDSLTGRP